MTQNTYAEARIVSDLAPAAFFARWADMGTWQEWNADTEWARLDGAFAKGATGVLKPKGGPKVRFVIAELSDTEFTDVSKLQGARLTFRHLVTVTAEGRTEIQVRVSFSGPLAFLWRGILGKGIAGSLQRDLEALAVAAGGTASAASSAVSSVVSSAAPSAVSSVASGVAAKVEA
jgi:hypothetical protein